MVFSSLVFLFVFLPLHYLVYALVPERAKNPVLLVSSLLFYAWGGPPYVLLLAGETAVCWACARGIERISDAAARKALVALACVALLGLLAYFKYTGLVLGTLRSLTGVPADLPTVVLPIGISFYTFQLLSYVVDVYRGEVRAQRSYGRLLLYSSLFHQCIAGPIVRYRGVAQEIERRRVSPSDRALGVRRFCIGLAKKSLLANACASVADTLVPAGSSDLLAQPVCGYWLGMLFYMLQIYLDFSAYSDMAIGLGRTVGFHYLENFDHPYQAVSVQDFWRRWHISLSSFFRDYVYIPLGGSRCSALRYVRNMAVVWLLTGLWHGASWNYVLWGVYYLVFLLFEKFVVRGRIPRPLGHACALVVVYIGWVLFRFENFAELLQVLRGLAGFAAGGFSSLAVRTVFLQNVFLLAISIVACTDASVRLRKWLYRRLGSSKAGLVAFCVVEAATPAVLLVLSCVALAGASYNPFIYFQF